MKRTVPLLITASVGLLLILHYFVPRFGDWADIAAIHFDVLAAIAFILGGGNLLRTHGEKIYKQQAGWAYSLIAVASFLAILFFGLSKFGVEAKPGMWTAAPMQSGETMGLAQLQITPESRKFSLIVRRAAAETEHAVFIGDRNVGIVKIDEEGMGEFKLKYEVPEPDDEEKPSEEAGDDDQAVAAAVLADLTEATPIRVGELLAGVLVSYPNVTGDYNQNGSVFWYLYEYGFKPLQQTTFAMLAFYVASAAFRAFRAKNFESILLLGTAFVILTGRTFIGTLMTQWLPDEGFWSFFQVPNLTGWIMQVWNTAGNRAIMIGIALGVASTSLKVLLGIDRSYLGSDKG